MSGPDIFSPEYAANPYPFYKEMRDHHPLYFHEEPTRRGPGRQRYARMDGLALRRVTLRPMPTRADARRLADARALSSPIVRSRRSNNLYLVALFLVVGCRAPSTVPTAAPPPHEHVEAEQLEPHVELELVELGRWRVTYHLEQPAERLRFWRAANWFREASWTVQTPGYELTRDGNSQILAVTEGGTATDTIVVEVASHAEPMVGEFRPMLVFSDGAAAFYTGHLYVRDTASESSEGAPYLETLAIRTPEAIEFALLGDVIRGGDATWWTDPHGSGTYVYFGTPDVGIEPYGNESMMLIADAGLPDVIQDEMQRLFPQLFEMLAASFEINLPWRPMIIAAWEEGHEGGHHWEGGVRPGVIYMGIGGGRWDMSDDGPFLDLAHFVAHEASHFWNATLIRNASNEPWVHEGSADAFADLLLHRLGLIDAEGLRGRQETAINRCLSTLDGEALRGAEERHSRWVHYSCGYLVSIWSEAVVDSADLFAIWAALLARVGESGDYEVSDYFTVLRDLSSSSALVDEIEEFIATDSEHQRAKLIDSFERAGRALSPAKRPPIDERLRLAALALRHLQKSACGKFSLGTFDSHLTSYPIDECPTFSDELEVYSIAGVPVIDGDLAHDRVRRACSRKNGAVKLSAKDGREVVEVRCKHPLPERHPWLSLAEPATEIAE
jgi:hypothetical protein